MAKRSRGVGSGTSVVASTAHTTEAQHVPTGEDIALGLTFQLSIGERRTVVIQTHTIRDAPEGELNALCDKVCAVLDRVNAKYRLKELALLRKQKQNQLAMIMDNNSAVRTKWEEEYEKNRGNRRGGFVMSPQQHNQWNTQLQMIDRHKAEIVDIETEVAETKQLIG